ncbi:hypothetical protein B1R94_08905 [Mycolicibacterium litorale]|nr:hypothetical protein B1R94_08905 [Mycolicibacterium litorale]
MTIAQPGARNDDHESAEICSGGDELTNRFLYEAMPFARELIHKARTLTPTHADAEDLMQETMLRAFRGYASFQPGTNMRAWLHRIQSNTWITMYRFRSRRPEEWPTDEFTDAQMWREAGDGVPGTCSAETIAIGRVAEYEVADAWRRIDCHQREVVYLADIEGLPYKDIARITGMPLGTVMSRLHRGRKALRALLEDYGRHRGYLRDTATSVASVTDTDLPHGYAG